MSRSGAAQEVRCLDDGRTWILELAEMRWSDGLLLDAQDVVWVWQDAFRHPSRRLSGLIQAAGRVQMSPVGRSTVRIEFERPVSYLDAMLALPMLAPRRRGGPSLGAYVLEEPGQSRPGGDERDRFSLRINLERSDLPSEIPERVQFRVIQDGMAAVEEFRAGRIDVTPTTGISESDLKVVMSTADVRTMPIDVFGSLQFGRRASAFRESALRRSALSMAINRAAIRSCAPLLVDVDAPHPTGAGGNLAAVGRALTEAAELIYADYPPNDLIANELKRQFGEMFGASVRCRALGLPEYARAAATGDYGLMYSLTVVEFGHPAARLAPWRTGGSAALSQGFSDPVFDRLVDAATAGFDRRLWDVAEGRLTELSPYVALTTTLANFLSSHRLREIHLTRSGLMPLDLVKTINEPRTESA